MRCSTKPHQFYCGIALHARTMSVCMLHQDGASVVQRHMPTRPAALLKTIAPERANMVIAVEGICTWYWLAHLWARERLPCVRGHALSMPALHGGPAKHARSEAQKIALLLRGGMLPHAEVSPAAMRATRDVLRRRRPRMRQRAARLTPGQQTNSQDTWPEIGTKIASTPHRAGVAERVAAPAVPTSLEGNLALLDSEDQRLRAVELALVPTATQPEANPLSVLQSLPGLGKLRSLGLCSARPDRARFPRVHDGVSSCRLGTCAQDSAGTRSGTSGITIGKASRQWAVSEAALLCLRNHPAGQQSLAR